MSAATIDLTPAAIEAQLATMQAGADASLGHYEPLRLNAMHTDGVDSGATVRELIPQFREQLAALLLPLIPARDAILEQLQDGVSVTVNPNAAGVVLASWARLLSAPAALAEKAQAFGIELDPTW